MALLIRKYGSEERNVRDWKIPTRRAKAPAIQEPNASPRADEEDTIIYIDPE